MNKSGLVRRQEALATLRWNIEEDGPLIKPYVRFILILRPEQQGKDKQ
jgi:hypothetical protein